MVRISVSSNPEKEDKLVDYVKQMQSYGADYMHMDVMDGNFVESKCLSANLVKEVRLNSVIMLDVHLMVKSPKEHILNYINAGANIVTIHYESYLNQDDDNCCSMDNKLDILSLLEDVNTIKTNKNTLVGISVKPSTRIQDLFPILKLFDLVLIMSVEPGKSGQKFMPEMLNKIKTLKEFILENNLKILIEVDGGINKENSKDIASSGADILVVGSALYNANDKKEFIEYIHSL